MDSSIRTLWNRFWKVRFFRFLLIGAVNTIFGYGVYALLIFLRCDYKIAALAGTVLGVLFNFLTTGRIVFGTRTIFSSSSLSASIQSRIFSTSGSLNCFC